jgi:hypothetical protein
MPALGLLRGEPELIVAKAGTGPDMNKYAKRRKPAG